MAITNINVFLNGVYTADDSAEAETVYARYNAILGGYPVEEGSQGFTIAKKLVGGVQKYVCTMSFSIPSMAWSNWAALKTNIDDIDAESAKFSWESFQISPI